MAEEEARLPARLAKSKVATTIPPITSRSNPSRLASFFRGCDQAPSDFRPRPSGSFFRDPRSESADVTRKLKQILRAPALPIGSFFLEPASAAPRARLIAEGSHLC